MAKRAARPYIAQPEDPSIRHVALTRGQVAVVDAEDFERVVGCTWTTLKSPVSGFYAVHYYRKDGRVQQLALHRFLMKLQRGYVVDHIDGDGLNNRRRNLRICTHAENLWNAKTRSATKSGLKGAFPLSNGMFRSQIAIGGKQIMLGSFPTADLANAAYMGAAKVLAGEFANDGRRAA